VAAIAEIVSDYPDIPLVLDPVLASGRGDQLADEALIEAMQDLLLPQVTLITPNSIEARRLAEDDLADEGDDPDLEECAARLIDFGCEYVLITGSHEQTAKVVNQLYGPEGLIQSLEWARLPGSYHGSGCTLAAACGALLALGLPMADAVKSAQEFTYEALRAGYRLGMGQAIPDRLFWARDDAAERT
jgi:hydroxymethylpyrimidine/phosphomethylpyrimidine kinase